MYLDVFDKTVVVDFISDCVDFGESVRFILESRGRLIEVCELFVCDV